MTPEEQLDESIDRFSPAVTADARAALALVAARLAAAVASVPMPVEPAGEPRLIIEPVFAKQRLRR